MKEPRGKDKPEAPLRHQGLLDRALSVFSDVRTGEAPTALWLLFSLLLIMASYYVLKTVREPLVLASAGAEAKSYAAAAQALLLMGFVPLYSWFSSRVGRRTLLIGVNLFFLVTLELFFLAVRLEMPGVGIAFFVWIGIFSLAIIAQFWSLANDVYSKEQGERLFPIVAIGAAAGSPLGAKLADLLFSAGMSISAMMQVAAGLLGASMLLTLIVHRREPGGHGARERGTDGQPDVIAGPSGFTLVLKSRYVMLIAGLLIVLNLVNTTGEYVLGKSVETAARAGATDEAAIEATIGSFYGNFYFIVNIATLVIQALVVSRVVKYLGMAGVLFALPLVALGTYATIAAGAGLWAMRWVKTAENSVDYSVMNTGKAMLWLPTSRADKYKAKQAVDTFFVRLGDVLSAGLVFAGTAWLGLGIQGFASVNLGLILLWMLAAWLLLRRYRVRSDDAQAQSEASSGSRSLKRSSPTTSG